MDQFREPSRSGRRLPGAFSFLVLNRLCAELRLPCSGGTTKTTAQAPGIECSAAVPGPCHLKRTSTMSDVSNTWNVTGVKMGSRPQYGSRGQQLVIEARPAYGNRKQWEGEFWFVLTPEQVDDLKKVVDDMSQKVRLIDVALYELMAIKNDFKEEFRDKVANVAKETGLTEDDLNHWDRNLWAG